MWFGSVFSPHMEHSTSACYHGRQAPGTHAWTPLPVSGPDSRLKAASQEKPRLPPQTVSLLALRKARCHVRCPKMWPKCSGAEGCLQQPATKTSSGTTRKEPSPANDHVNKPGGQSCPSEAFIWTADSLNTTSSETLSRGTHSPTLRS